MDVRIEEIGRQQPAARSQSIVLFFGNQSIRARAVSTRPASEKNIVLGLARKSANMRQPPLVNQNEVSRALEVYSKLATRRLYCY